MSGSWRVIWDYTASKAAQGHVERVLLTALKTGLLSAGFLIGLIIAAPAPKGLAVGLLIGLLGVANAYCFALAIAACIAINLRSMEGRYRDGDAEQHGGRRSRQDLNRVIS